jgi:protein gp37
VALGCALVSEGCAHCWALATARRLEWMGKPGYEGLVENHGRWTGERNLLEKRLEAPFRLKRARVIAVHLTGDLFHPEIPEDFIE